MSRMVLVSAVMEVDGKSLLMRTSTELPDKILPSLLPVNWKERLVAQTLDPFLSGRARFVAKVAIVVFTAFFMLGTCCVGYILLRKIFDAYVEYEQRVSEVMNKAGKIAAWHMIAKLARQKFFQPGHAIIARGDASSPDGVHERRPSPDHHERRRASSSVASGGSEHVNGGQWIIPDSDDDMGEVWSVSSSPRTPET